VYAISNLNVEEIVGESGRPLVVWLGEQYLRQEHLEKSKFVQHAFEGHQLIVGMKPRDQQLAQEI